MKILMCHNYYQQPGGEDQSYEAEVRLLESRGHEVVRFTRHNDDIREMGRWKVACGTLWNRQSYRDLRQLIRRERPEVMHCTNIFPLISPAAYSAAQAEGVPVVQSLRNYRMFCSNSLLMRNDRVCEDCLGKSFAWPAVAHACYRDSRTASSVVVAMQIYHRLKQTWHRNVNRYIALTEFSRQKYATYGLPVEKISIKPNFVFPDPGPGDGRGGYAIFAGRLSAEKGIDTLLAAWPRLKRPVTLKIVGDGPLADRVRAAAHQHSSIQWLGRLPVEELLTLIGDAACLVCPRSAMRISLARLSRPIPVAPLWWPLGWAPWPRSSKRDAPGCSLSRARPTNWPRKSTRCLTNPPCWPACARLPDVSTNDATPPMPITSR